VEQRHQLAATSALPPSTYADRSGQENERRRNAATAKATEISRSAERGETGDGVHEQEVERAAAVQDDVEQVADRLVPDEQGQRLVLVGGQAQLGQRNATPAVAAPTASQNERVDASPRGLQSARLRVPLAL
jgi:hypothetical protein